MNRKLPISEIDEEFYRYGPQPDPRPAVASTDRRFPPVDLPDGWRFVVDSNEAQAGHLAYDMHRQFEDVAPVVANLHVGDYSVIDPQGVVRDREVCVERKSLVNIVGDLTNVDNRRCLEAAFEKMAAMPWSCVVIESDWQRVGRPLARSWKHEERLKRAKRNGPSPNAVQGSLLKWMMRWRLPVHFAGDRLEGERVTRWMLAHYAVEAHKRER